VSHSDLAAYSRTHRHLLTDDLPPLLRRVFEPGVIADLGCGDGSILWALDRVGALREHTYAVDLSPDRVAAVSRVLPGLEGLVGDATSAPIADEAVDGVICSQVIEHLPDDLRLAPELVRILRPGGWFYVGSVSRGAHAWWIYRDGGERILDPTHVREYESLGELVAALEHPDLEIGSRNETPLRFPVLDLGLRALALARALTFDQLLTAYERRPRLARLRALTVRVPGYSVIEVAGHKRGSGRPA
jgi:SAM-dependent methyltransferase